MKTIKKLVSATIAVLFCTMGAAQIKNAKTQTVTIQGNCGMCQSTIEKAGTKKKVSTVAWNKDTKVATLTFDSNKTNEDEILKRVALSGYDNEKFLAPDDVYSKLHGCCKYERPKTVTANHSDQQHNSTPKEAMVKENQLEQVYALYFDVKDALIKEDATTASQKSKALFAAFEAVKMDKLGSKEHEAFMKDLDALKMHAEHISNTKDIEHQREHFSKLSEFMYSLMKAIKPSYTVYLDNCPMYNDGKGANWISKESAIKNPYYGSKMMTCGKVKETLK